MAEMTFLGHAAVMLKFTDGTLIVDPFLTGNPMAGIDPGELRVDHVLLTHGHPDHLGDGIDIAIRNKATVIAPFELAAYCESRGAKAHAMHIGGSHDFPFGRVKLTIAVHGSGLPTADGILYLGSPCGYLVMADGFTVYHAGDTGLFYDMKLIGEMNRIDVAFLPIGGNFTMDIDDAVKAAGFLRASLAIPIHYDTFDLIKASPEIFVQRLERAGLRGKILRAGEGLTL